MLAGSKYLPDAWKHEIQCKSYFDKTIVPLLPAQLYIFKIEEFRKMLRD